MIENRQNILKKPHYLLLKKVCIFYLQLYWFIKKISNRIAIWDKFAIYFYNNLLYQFQNLPNIPEDLTNMYLIYTLYFFNKLLKESEKIFE